MKKPSQISGLRAAIDSALHQHQIAQSLLPHRALVLWPGVVGEPAASASTAEAVKGGVLFVRARSAVWATELTYQKQRLISMINSALGANVITDIHFRSGGKQPNPNVNRPDHPPLPTGPSESDLSQIHNHSLTPDSQAQSTLPEITHLRHRISRTTQWKRQNGWIECSSCHALFSPQSAGPSNTPALCPHCLFRKHL